MKITMTENSKNCIHVSEMPEVRKIMNDLKEDTGMMHYAKMAARVASGKNDDFEILKATAEMAQNCRVWNAYTDNSEKLDVWLEVYAYNPYHGFFDIGIYLTDVWAITGYNSEEIKSHMYIKPFYCGL